MRMSNIKLAGCIFRPQSLIIATIFGLMTFILTWHVNTGNRPTTYFQKIIWQQKYSNHLIFPADLRIQEDNLPDEVKIKLSNHRGSSTDRICVKYKIKMIVYLLSVRFIGPPITIPSMPSNHTVQPDCYEYNRSATMKHHVIYDVTMMGRSSAGVVHDVTMVTQMSDERLDRLHLIMRHWEGNTMPIYYYSGALVVPAFEEIANTTRLSEQFPENKADLLRLWSEDKVEPFQ
ncbi:hypothetical protein LSH36_413g02036 [Paralvinella palmiformis]|uniref:Uncharacterized protein n=1 Tax=Paralvinella palmiformis TaxID=53620 RepID=A0AAD9JDA8_9ANNE|nr:hypothetical protein LSH36_413g02036 [Paralvinella palmiformis]